MPGLPNPQELAQAQEFYKSQLRRLYWASVYRNNPGGLARKVNERLAKERFLADIVGQRFVTGGASHGAQWPALTASTIRQRGAQGFAAGPILVRSGALAEAATSGKEKATETSITLEFKDGPAPRYVGGGAARRRRGKRQVRDASQFFGQAIGASGFISDYAFALNRRRPFFDEPTVNELQPLFRARDMIVSNIAAAIMTGGRVSDAIQLPLPQ